MKNAFILSVVALLMSLSVNADQTFNLGEDGTVSLGAEGVGGGDSDEIRFNEIRKDILKWIEQDKHLQLNLNTSYKKITHETYKSKMIEVLSSDNTLVSFTNDIEKVKVNGHEKDCRSYIKGGARHILCHDGKFNTNIKRQHQIVHHEYAVLAKLEDGAPSSYEISQQITGHIKLQLVYKLSIDDEGKGLEPYLESALLRAAINAIRENNTETLNYLMSKGLPKDNNQLVRTAVKNQNFDIAITLINSGHSYTKETIFTENSRWHSSREYSTLRLSLAYNPPLSFIEFLLSRGEQKIYNYDSAKFPHRAGDIFEYIKEQVQKNISIDLNIIDLLISNGAYITTEELKGLYGQLSYRNSTIEKAKILLLGHSDSGLLYKKLIQTSGAPLNWKTVAPYFKHHFAYCPNNGDFAQTSINRVRATKQILVGLNIRITSNEGDLDILAYAAGFKNLCSSPELLQALIDQGANPRRKSIIKELLSLENKYDLSRGSSEEQGMKLYDYLSKAGYISPDILGPKPNQFGYSYGYWFKSKKTSNQPIPFTTLLYDTPNTVSVATKLLSLGANPNIKLSTSQVTPFNNYIYNLRPARQSSEQIFNLTSLYLGYGAQTKIKNAKGREPLSILKKKKLLKKKDVSKETYATQKENVRILKALLKEN